MVDEYPHIFPMVAEYLKMTPIVAEYPSGYSAGIEPKKNSLLRSLLNLISKLLSQIISFDYLCFLIIIC